MTYSEDTERKMEQTRQKLLLRNAVYVSPQSSDTRAPSSLLKKMVKMSADLKTPVKSEFNGREFVIDKGMPMKLALKAWKEQAVMPWLEEFKPEVLAKILKRSSDCTLIEDSEVSFQSAAAGEILATKYPEYAGELTTLQLLNSYYRASDENIDKVGQALYVSFEKYLSGEETFPPTLDNVIALQKLPDSFLARQLEDSSKLEERIKKTELEMLQQLTPEDLMVASDKLLADGRQIAKKYKDKGDFEKMFTNEIVQNRLAKDQIYDPR